MSDELRNLMRGSANNVSVPADNLGDVIRGGRSLRWRRRLYAAAVALLVATVTWTGLPGLTSLQDKQEGPKLTGTPTPGPSRGDCGLLEPRAGWLPDGWSYVFHEGSGGQIGVPVDQQSPRARGHFTVMDRKPQEPSPFVDVFRFGDTHTLPNDEAGWEGIKVLGEYGKIGRIHGGYAVEFHTGGCAYSMVGYGISKADLAAIAKSLEWAHNCDSSGVVGPDANVNDGRHFVYIKAVDVVDHGMGIQFDRAEFLTGAEANKAAIAAGAIETSETVPNDYFIVNQSKRTEALGFADDVEVYIETLQDGVPGLAPADTLWLACAFDGRVPFDEQHRRSPYWITVEDHEVTKIEQQYLP